LRDAGYLKFDEPFTRLFHQGTITRNGAKMSKSKGNAVSPDEFIEKHGSDTFRAYLMFMGPYDEGGDWNDQGITGIHRFLNRIWNLLQLPANPEPSDLDQYWLHKTIKVVSNDLTQMKFNTAISRLMEFVNYYSGRESIDDQSRHVVIQLLAPLAPHIAEELWQLTGQKGSVFNSSWPTFNAALAERDTVKIAIQINGKLRGDLEVEKNMDREELLGLVMDLDITKKYTANKNIIKEIVVPNRLVNIVVK